MAIIACCDNCGKENVPGSHHEAEYERGLGGDTSQCFVCQGDDFDPYGETEDGATELRGIIQQVLDDEPAPVEPFPSQHWHGG